MPIWGGGLGGHIYIYRKREGQRANTGREKRVERERGRKQEGQSERGNRTYISIYEICIGGEWGREGAGVGKKEIYRGEMVRGRDREMGSTYMYIYIASC